MNYPLFTDGNKTGPDDTEESAHSTDFHTFDSPKPKDSSLEVEGCRGELMPEDLTARKYYSFECEEVCAIITFRFDFRLIRI